MSPSNWGKRFEADWKRSTPSGVYLFRPADCGGWRRGVPEIRFTPSNPFDFIMYREPTMWALELKTVKGKSIRFDVLRPNQEKGLLQAAVQGVQAGVVVLFRGVDEIYYIPIQMWLTYARASSKVSMNNKEADEIGVAIGAEVARTRYTIKIDCFLAKFGEEE